MEFIEVLVQSNYCILGIFCVGKFFAKIKIWGCVIFSQSPIFTLKGSSLKYMEGLFFTVSIFGNFREVANLVKLKPT